MFEKHTLIKIVCEDGKPCIDIKQRKFGRGAYICKNESCVNTAKKKRALQRQLKMQIDEAFYAELAEAANG